MICQNYYYYYMLKKIQVELLKKLKEKKKDIKMQMEKILNSSNSILIK